MEDDSLPNGFVIKRQQRLHLFICDDQKAELIEKIISDAATLIGHYIPAPLTDPRSLERIVEQRHEIAYADEEAGAVRFDVYKNTMRYE